METVAADARDAARGGFSARKPLLQMLIVLQLMLMMWCLQGL